jgi:predicted dehydrogenase
VEKPLATTAEEAEQIERTFKNRRKVTMVGFQKRFSGPFRQAKEFLSKGILGELGFFRSHIYSPENIGSNKGWRYESKGGGATLDFGAHLVDMVLWYFGEPASVHAVTRALFSHDVEDYSHTVLTYSRGLVGYMDICWGMRNFRPGEMMIEIHGSEGAMSITEDRLILHLGENQETSQGVHLMPASQLTEAVPYLLASPENTLEDVQFLNCLKSRAESPCSFGDAKKVNRLIDLIKGGA